jgi:uncharacterized protein (DUF169 family)
MAPLDTYHEWGRSLSELLRLQTFPLAIKLVKREDEMPEKTRRPSSLNMRITMCQGYTMSRRIGWTIGLTAADMKCTPNLIAYGFAELKDPNAFVEAFRAMDYYKTDAAATRMVATIPRLKPRQYTGVVISPLPWTKVEPDLVLIYGNSAQIMRLIQAAIYSTGEPIASPQAGIAASCLGGALRTFVTKKSNVVIPGAGDRIFAATQDHEVVFACPRETLEETVASLQKAGYTAGIRYPLPIQLTEPLMPPEAWRILERELKSGSAAR